MAKSLLHLCFDTILRNEESDIVKSFCFLPHDLRIKYRKIECFNMCGYRVSSFIENIYYSIEKSFFHENMVRICLLKYQIAYLLEKAEKIEGIQTHYDTVCCYMYRRVSKIRDKKCASCRKSYYLGVQ